MLQSQQTWLPVLHEPVKFDKLIIRQFDNLKKSIAHCLPEGNKEHLQSSNFRIINQLILIGPEGDFTKEEIDLALQNNFMPVSIR